MKEWWQSEDAFKDAVAEATVEAEKAVARIHRRRLVAWSSAVSFIVACLVAIPTTYFLARQPVEDLQAQRHFTISHECERVDRSNVATKARLRSLHFPAAAEASTILLIDALAPYRNCAQVVREATQ